MSEVLWDEMGKQGFQSGMADKSQAGDDLSRLPDGGELAAHPYMSFLHKVEKPGRYLGGELHTQRKVRQDLNIALAFPDLYEIGMSHLGYQILYSHLNGLDDTRAERVYAPWPDLEGELRERGLPLVTLESWTPLSEFDCVGFSLQYELTFTNILTMLDLGGIPLHSSERGDEHPLVMAGGPVAFQPEPMATFIDAFLLGDGERFFYETVALWTKLRNEGVPRAERLRRISSLPGIYVPSLYDTAVDPVTDLEVVTGPRVEGVPDKVSRAHVEDISEFPFPAKTPVPNTEVVFDRASIEIARGCTEGCRFCQAGMIYRPVRERDPQQVAEVVKESVKCGGFDEVSLTSLSTADYSAVQPLVKRVMEDLRDKNVSLSVSSLRAYGLSEEMLDEIASVRNTSLTFAPEAGTQRMRDVVNKNITEEDITASAHRIFSRGWKRMKLYFMIGLPSEADEDVVGIAETGKRMLGIAREYLPKGRAKVTVSVSSHVPKPFTPFQWAQMDDIVEIERKHKMLRESTRMNGLQLRWHEPQSSHLEGILSRGDRRLSAVIEGAWRKGCRFDSWGDHLKFELWMETLDELEIDRRPYLSTIPVDGRVPWDHIDCGVEWRFLQREYQKALRNRLSPPCGKPFKQQVHHTNLEDALEEKRKLVCFDCGVACDMTRMREERIEFLEGLDAHRVGEPKPEEDLEQLTERIRSEFQERRRLEGHNKGKPRPPERRDQGPAHTYRLRYTKLGRARFMGHLDLVRLLPRAFRRAGFELIYSQGFHPQPILSFAPPLRLGLASVGEMMEIKLADQLPAEELIGRVNEALPDGFILRGGHEVQPGAPKLSKVTTWADYLAFVDREFVTEEVRERVPHLLSQDLRVERQRKNGRTKVVNIAEGTDEVTILEELPQDCYPHLELPEEDVIVAMRVGLTGEHMVRPEELLRFVFDGQVPPATRIVRRRLLPTPVVTSA